MELINKFNFEYITEYVYYKNYDFLIHEIYYDNIYYDNNYITTSWM